MKVAAIQFSPEYVVPIFEQSKVGSDPFLARRGNLQKIAKLVEEAASNGAKLIVLPELCTTGYSFMGPEEAAPHAEEIAETAPTMQIMRALASKYGAHIVWGMVEKEVGSGDLCNSQVIVSPDGSYHKYAKINPWGNDYLWAKPGRSNPPIVTIEEGGRTYKVGLLICRDVRDKKDDAWSSFYSKGDADIVCLSANWGDGGFPAVSWMDFVKDNNSWLVVSNRCGQEGPNNFGEGGSCIISPKGAVQCKGLIWSQDCIVYGTVG